MEIGELAEHMDLSDEAVDEISQFANTSQSLDNWQAEGGEEGFDVLVDPGQETDLVMRDVADCLSSVLSQQDRQIFILRVHTGLPLRAVGKMVDISAPETVRRIVQKATERMKGCLTEKGWGAHEE